MTTFKINPRNLDKWIYQNHGIVDDVIEGCLIDNYLIECERGTAFVYETYVNPNMSTYTVHFYHIGEVTHEAWGTWFELAHEVEKYIA